MDRITLHEKFCELLGTRNVYFQPPDYLKLTYPAIIYHVSSLASKKADNTAYKIDTRYDVVYVTTDPDDSMKTKILTAFPMCSFVSAYIADGLYHYKYDLYFA